MSIYENPELRRALGNTMRPGGLDLTEHALRLLEMPVGARILDIGCGPGENLKLFQRLGFEAVGLDLSPLLTAEAARHGDVVRANAQWLPFCAGCMDAVFLECVLSLVPDKEQALRECRRVLKPGGRLVLADLYAKEDEVPHITRQHVRSCSSSSSSGAQKEPKDVAVCCKDRPETTRTSMENTKAVDCQNRATNAHAGNCPDGALPLSILRELLRISGFRLQHEEDRSRALGELAARMVWELGSANSLYKLLRGREDDTPCACGPVRKKHGYMLFVAVSGKE